MARELCFVCNAETDKAGRADDSIYFGAIGPWCDSCAKEVRDAVTEEQADNDTTRHEAMRAALERLASEAQKYVEGYEDDSKRAARSFCQGCYSRPTMLEDEVEKARALLDAEKPEAGRGSA